MKEPAYNLFIYIDLPAIKELGVAVHDLDGTDQEKLSALQKLVGTDHKIATRYQTKRPITWQDYNSLARLGLELNVFEEIFRDFNASQHPLVVITPIIDEKPYFEAVTKLGPLRRDDLRGTPLEEPGMMVDYLQAYMTEEGFDIPRLLNDDYFLAIKLLFNNRYFVSCAKLLISFIDTVAFIDAGDIKDSFILWLDAYSDLASIGITSKELWEYRNGLLHMTNLSSPAITSGKTAPLILYVGNPIEPLPPLRSGARYFNLKGLIDTIANAVSRWIETYSHSFEKRINFVSRYDLTVSDSRVAYVGVGDASEADV